MVYITFIRNISLICNFEISDYSEILGSIFFCGIMLIPLLYFSNWNLNLLFNKPTKNELILALLMFICYIIYALIMYQLLDLFGLASSSTDLLSVTWESVVGLIFSMMGEELLKFIPLMFLLRFFYHFSERKDVSLVFASIIVLTMFGLLHYNYQDYIIEPILIQGFGSIFELYGYVKTKNLLVPYLSHLFTDAFIMIMILLGL